MDIWDPKSQEPSLVFRACWAILYTGFILVNVASNLGWLGASNKDVSGKFEVPLTPAGWAFSIWGVIFILQGVGTVYQFIPAGYEPDGWKQRFVNSVGWSWMGTWVLSSCWQFAFVQQTPVGMWVALLFIFASLLAIGYGLLQMYRLLHQFGSAPNPLLYVSYFLPTSINTAWLSVASAVQLLIAIRGSHHLENLETPSVLLAAVVSAGGGYLVLRHRDTAYGLTLIWALVAVYEKTPSVAVRNTVIGALVAVGGVTLLSVLRRSSEGGQAQGPALRDSLSADVEARQPLREGGSRGP